MGILFMAAGLLHADPQFRVRTPLFDGHGRFWIYRNGPAHPRMPFSPYGWMSDSTSTNLNQLLHVDLECRDRPCTMLEESTPEERNCCMRVRVTWTDATWASVAFISGPDDPPWWGDNNSGSYYDLSNLPKKKLVFYARGEHGGEVIQAQIGLLGNKPFGDSLHKPVASEDVKLTQDWARYEVDLNNVQPSELTRVCNGFGATAQLAKQPGTPTETVFYIDDVYYE